MRLPLNGEVGIPIAAEQVLPIDKGIATTDELHVRVRPTLKDLGDSPAMPILLVSLNRDCRADGRQRLKTSPGFATVGRLSGLGGIDTGQVDSDSAASF